MEKGALMTDEQTPDRRGDSLLRMAEVKARTGLSRATIYRHEADGTFPRKVQLGPKMVAWYGSDIDAFIAAPMAFRQND